MRLKPLPLNRPPLFPREACSECGAPCPRQSAGRPRLTCDEECARERMNRKRRGDYDAAPFGARTERMRLRRQLEQQRQLVDELRDSLGAERLLAEYSAEASP